MCSQANDGAVGVDFQQPALAAALLRQAGALARAGGTAAPLLAGKQLALVTPDGADAAATAFIEAAKALGARVSSVRAGLDDASSDEQVDNTARMLGQLYDAVECQHLPVSLVRRIARSAGIPVFAGLATPAHPTVALVAQLEGEASLALKRRSVLQAALLVTLN
ncbi:ornithine carbamoyltransferase [Roseateles puraquae]|uniref:ornithine carbamoyltransferase n=1 Tax=Roseateles puraquae TaxID=431059 RepID=UPI0031E3E7EF